MADSGEPKQALQGSAPNELSDVSVLVPTGISQRLRWLRTRSIAIGFLAGLLLLKQNSQRHAEGDPRLFLHDTVHDCSPG